MARGFPRISSTTPRDRQPRSADTYSMDTKHEANGKPISVINWTPRYEGVEGRESMDPRIPTERCNRAGSTVALYSGGGSQVQFAVRSLGVRRIFVVSFSPSK
jgi:hypothetical protein